MQKPGANAGVKSSRERTRSHQNTRSGRHGPSPATYSARTERIDMFDKATIRNDFPILAGEAYGHALVYLDNAATTQVPAVVLDAVAEHYRTSNANVHRGMHYLAHRSTQGYESARARVATFINAPDERCVVFTRGTTDSINMAALGLSHLLGPGDCVVTTVLEHHSNFVPWQMACKRQGADFAVADIDEAGDIDLDGLSRLIDEGRPKIVAVSACSNVLGCVTPLKSIVSLAHEVGALCLVDGAQAMRHTRIDVQDIGCDFLCFSGHKIMAPTGIGVLYGSPAALELVEPSAFGGEMVDIVKPDETTFEQLPLRLEAGTPNYVGAIALATALDYLESCGRDAVARYEDELVAYAEQQLARIPGLHVLGAPRKRSGCVSFVIDGVHPFDLCTIADKHGVALRSGNNCAQPLLARLGTTSVARLSPAFYNTKAEIDVAAETVEHVASLLANARSPRGCATPSSISENGMPSISSSARSPRERATSSGAAGIAEAVKAAQLQKPV